MKRNFANCDKIFFDEDDPECQKCEDYELCKEEEGEWDDDERFS